MTKEEAQRLTDPNEVRILYYREEGSKILYWAVIQTVSFEDTGLKFIVHTMQDADNPFNHNGMALALPYSEIKDII